MFSLSHDGKEGRPLPSFWSLLHSTKPFFRKAFREYLAHTHTPKQPTKPNSLQPFSLARGCRRERERPKKPFGDGLLSVALRSDLWQRPLFSFQQQLCANLRPKRLQRERLKLAAPPSPGALLSKAALALPSTRPFGLYTYTQRAIAKEEKREKEEGLLGLFPPPPPPFRQGLRVSIAFTGLCQLFCADSTGKGPRSGADKTDRSLFSSPPFPLSLGRRSVQGHRSFSL